MKNDREHAESRKRRQEIERALQLGQYDILADESRVEGVINHLCKLLKTGELPNLQAILTEIKACCCQDDEQTRRLGLYIISRFLRSSQSNKLPASLLRIAAQAFSQGLRSESSGQEDASSDTLKTYHAVVARLVGLALWGDLADFLRVLSVIPGETTDNASPSGKDLQPYCSAESTQKIIALLVGAFARAKAAERQQIKDVLKLFGDEAILPLIEELFKHPNKEVRIALFEVIPRRANIIVPGILKRLAVKQPWYVLRNAILILALLDDSGLFCLVKPFLKHPDHRVQKAVIDFIALAGSDDVRGDLVDAILVVDDQLLPGLVLLLQQHGGEEIEAAFLALLSDRYQVAASVRDELVVRLCESGRLPICEKSLEILDKIISEEAYSGMSGSQVHLAATEAMQVIQHRKSEIRGQKRETGWRECE